MKLLLDTNVISAIMRRDHRVREKLRLAGTDQVGIPSVVVQEICFGAHRSPNRDVYLTALGHIDLPVVEFDEADARAAGKLRAQLADAGRPIGPFDVLIAGQALARDLTLVTHNVGEFSHVDGLKLEDWEA